jgi:hypothetical protein
MHMKFFKNIAILGLAVGLFACEEQLELQPFQSLATSEALNSVDNMRVAVNGAYDGLQGLNYYGRDFQVQADVEADMVYITTANSNRFILNYTYDFNQDSEGGIFDDAYRVILRVNNVINNIDDLEGNQTRKDQIKGEALAIRALAHFDLVRLYGVTPSQGNPSSDLGVPIILEAQITEPARNTVAEVYNQVIADLNAAQGLVGDNGTFNFGTDAINALLARVHLYRGNYNEAITAASAVINSGNYALADDYAGIFGAPGTSSEEIFTLRFTQAENRGSNNLGSIYNPDSYGDIRPSNDFFDLFEDGDQRSTMVYTATKSGAEDIFHSKYLSQDGIPGLHSPRLLRLAEMYLIRAEANWRLDNTADAAADLNTLRTVRGASEITEGDVDAQFIVDERQREMAFEGHAKFDYYRLGLDIVRDQCNTDEQITAPCTISITDPKMIYPIPQYETLVNQAMVQNPGY